MNTTLEGFHMLPYPLGVMSSVNSLEPLNILGGGLNPCETY